jgi:hypothetical protein
MSWVALVVACSATPDPEADDASSGGSPGAESGGQGATGGAPLSGSGGAGGGASGGETASGGQVTSGGASASDGGSGNPAGGRDGSGGRGPSIGGGPPGGSGGMPGNGGAQGSGGDSGDCVPNIACKLDPPPSTGDLYQDCVDRINQFRTECACLPPLERRMDGEACADQMAEYDAGVNQAHAGAIAKICQPGGAQNECPGYSSNAQVIGLCLQQMWDEGPPPVEPCEGECFQTYGHFINMTDLSMKRVACGFYTTASGKVWAVQNFTR